jgi:hypothetical protein
MFSRHVADLARAGVHFPAWPGLEDAAAGAVSSGNGQPARSNTAAMPWPPPMHIVSRP